jgi:hypothetical protein
MAVSIGRQITESILNYLSFIPTVKTETNCITQMLSNQTAKQYDQEKQYYLYLTLPEAYRYGTIAIKYLQETSPTLWKEVY